MLSKEKDEVHVTWNPKEEKVNGRVPKPDGNAAFFCLTYAEGKYIYIYIAFVSPLLQTKNPGS